MGLFIARQPIFDLAEKVFAYDVTALVPGGGGIHVEPTPQALIAELFMEIGIDRVAPDQRVFITLDRELLLSEALPNLPPDRVVFEVPPALNADALVSGAVTRMRKAGYQIAAHALSCESAEIVSIADVVKLDVASVNARELSELVGQVKRRDARLLAMNVRHRGERDTCLELGFSLFEGYRFAAPENLSTKAVEIEHMLVFRLIKLLRDNSVSDAEIEQLLRQDVGLSYRLLRLVNSAAIGAREIWSIGHALRLLGREPLARWLCVLLATQVGDSGVHAQLVHLALVRARMCERLADAVHVPAARGPLFLVGMLSVFDQLLETTMEALCQSMALAPDLRNALEKREDLFGVVLQLVEHYVAGEWIQADQSARALGVDLALLPDLYVEALAFASSQSSGNADPAPATAGSFSRA